MITILSTCRSFQDPQFNIIQRNAIQSWLLLMPQPQIVLMGNDPGTKEICQEFNLIHTDVKVSQESGVPLLDSMIENAEKTAVNDLMLLVSSDMMVFQDTIESAIILKEYFKDKPFMAGVRRCELPLKYVAPIDFSTNWEQTIKSHCKRGSRFAGDYFLFTKGYFGENCPSFFIGRAYCDNWLHWYGNSQNNLVEITVYAIHQDHHHRHWPVPDDLVTSCETSPEFIINKKLAENKNNIIGDAHLFMKNGKIWQR